MTINQKTNVDFLTDNFNRALNGLYRDGDKRKDARFAPDTLAFHERGIKARYLAGLFKIKNAAESQQRQADKLEAKSQRGYEAYLSDAEVSSYQLRKPIIAKDTQNMSFNDILVNAKVAASSGSKSGALAHLESLPEPKTAPQQKHLDAVKSQLEAVIVPLQMRNAGSEAHRLRLEAEEERVQALSALHDLSGDKSTFNPFS